MSSLESLADPNYRPRKGPECSISIMLRQMDDETAALAIAAMSNPYAGSTSIVDAITERGHKVSRAAMQRHRRGECRCEA